MTASAGEDAREELEVDPELVERWMSLQPPPQLIDVREPPEHEAGHIDQDRHIPLTELSAAAASIERDRPVVFYCRVGARSEMAAQAFRASGFEAYTMRGGLLRWEQEGRVLLPAGGYVARE